MEYVLALLGGLATLWLVLALALIVARPRGLPLREAALLMPDVVRLVRDLARDRTIPRRVRARIWLLVAWMASPIDAIPDVIPVVGVVDDVILAYFVLRSVARAAGHDVLVRHWPGGDDGLCALERLLRLDAVRSPPPAPRTVAEPPREDRDPR